MNKVLLFSLIGVVVREATVQLIEQDERRKVFQQARAYADSTNKPLLVVGTPKSLFHNHPCGDVTIDINTGIVTDCDVEEADVRSIPYPSHYFGSVYISHVLEHLPTIDDCYRALDELQRVADRVFVVTPHKTSLAAWLHPDHHLWVLPDGDGYIIEQRGKAGQAAYTISACPCLLMVV